MNDSSAISRDPTPPGRDPVFNRTPLDGLDRDELLASFRSVRQATEALADGLSPEDQNLQSMPEASPLKWHRAHTTWFFEQFILHPWMQGYRSFNEPFAYLFNSYYNGIGAQFPRAQRSLISRPDTVEVGDYRAWVDQAMERLIGTIADDQLAEFAGLMVLGLNHEQQHQELAVTDLKHGFSFNPLAPAWRDPAPKAQGIAGAAWIGFPGGIHEIGSPDDRFCFDNETPRHRVLLQDYELARRPVTCGEYLDFMHDDGYSRPELWLADGWAWVCANDIEAPLYWSRETDDWQLYTLAGTRPVDPDEPICHISFYEAFAYAQWAGARLPSEAEWEIAARGLPVEGHFADRGLMHPTGAPDHTGPVQMFGDIWEWTASSYASYPGFRAAPGAVGEYNGKFMANQMVLRGGSCATPAGHIRPGYRNFFYPVDRWQFSGLRLARDC